jgi:hypothetical protein
MIRGVGVAWYSPEAWRELAAIPEAGIEKTYAEYLHSTAAIERQLAAAGMRAERVAVNIAEMVAWCRRHGYAPDDKGRAAYGALLTMALDDPAVMDHPLVDETREGQH